MLPQRYYFVACLLVAAILAGCLGDVRHSNPLDPESDEFEEVGRVQGTTTRFYPPFAAVEQAEVRLTPGPIVTYSDAEGRFALDGIPVGEYELTASKDGFVSRSQTVRVELSTPPPDVTARLDGLPVLRNVSVRSAHISRWFPPDDLFLLEIVAQVEDPDGLSDLDHVAFQMPDRSFERALSETAVAGRYEIALPADSLPGENLYALLGEEITVTASDDAGFEQETGPHFIVRVIDYTPVAVDPQGQRNVGTSTPTLTWEDAALPYTFSYRIDIVRDQANVQTVVRTIEDISSDLDRYTLETPLPPGTYFWTISVVDVHGNRSRSKEAGFIVPQ